MTKKMIGLAMSSMDAEGTIDLYRGIRDAAEQNEYSTQGFVIYPSSSSSKIYNDGEFYIFQTIDFTKYDAVIASMNTFADASIRDKLIERINKASIPVIAIDCDLKNAYIINNDNYNSVKEMLNYLINHFGRTKINYVSGPLDNIESRERLKAYEDGMKENNLSTEGRIYNGSFFVQDGEAAVKFFDNSPQGADYDAIMCGNDMAAIALYAELKNRKVRIPEDVIITGYDNIKETKFVSVYSIYRDNYQTGKLAIDMLRRYWNGEQLPKSTNIPAYVDYKKMNNVYGSDIREKLIYKSFVTEKLVHAYISCFVEDSTKCTDFDEYIDVVKTFIQRINPPMFTFTVTDEYSEMFHIEDYYTTPMIDADGNTLYMTNVIMYENGQFIDPREMVMPNVMFPELNEKNEQDTWEFVISRMPVKQLLNTPLHFLDKNFGFVSFSQSELPLMANMYWDWIMALNYTINNVYQNILKREVYMHDALTGAYNRLGFEYYKNYFVDQSDKRQLDISIIFADMNGLKPINDNLGHESGDLAIRTVADALNKYSNKRLKLCRYGGDEFIMLGIGYTEDEIKEIITNLEKEVPALGEKRSLEFKVSASIGYYIRKSGSAEDMESCINKADAQMYEKKKKYKEALKNN